MKDDRPDVHRRKTTYANYVYNKFAVWGMIIGFVGSVTFVTTILGIQNLEWETLMFMKFLVVVGWSMIAGAGIGIVFDLLRHTLEPEFPDESEVFEYFRANSRKREKEIKREEEELRKAA